MKIVSLNVWAGKVFDPLMAYLAERSRDTDVFCFQEVFRTPTNRVIDDTGVRCNLLGDLERALGEYVPFFAAECGGFDIMGRPVDFPLQFGNALFLRKGNIAVEYGTEFVHGEYTEKPRGGNENMPRVLQHITVRDGETLYTVAAFHGLWNGQGKGDSPERLAQSRRVRAYIEKRGRPLVLCGDLNLNPNTESLRIIGSGLCDLVAEYGITSTRSSLYTKPGTRFADYVFVSPDIRIHRFAVPDVTVSDHLPLEITIE